jgi:DNA-directed RNA polymerase subunit M/transcription elongation factor TFIIS
VKKKVKQINKRMFPRCKQKNPTKSISFQKLWGSSSAKKKHEKRKELIITPAIRLRVLNTLAGVLRGPNEIGYAGKLEEHMYSRYKDEPSTLYISKFKQLYDGLVNNHHYLCIVYDPKELVDVENELLLENGQSNAHCSITKQPLNLQQNDIVISELELLQKQQKENDIYASSCVGTTHVSPIQSEIICRKCFHNKVDAFRRQARSADEPQTCFCTCQSCGHKWIMN